MTDSVSNESEFYRINYDTREELLDALDNLLKPGEHYAIHTYDIKYDIVDITYMEKQLKGEVIEKSGYNFITDESLLSEKTRLIFHDYKLNFKYKASDVVNRESAWKECDGLYILNLKLPETRTVKSARRQLDQMTLN